MQKIFDDFRNLLYRPFRGEMDAFQLSLAIGLVLVIIWFWYGILAKLRGEG